MEISEETKNAPQIKSVHAHTNTIPNANQLDNEMPAGQSIKW